MRKPRISASQVKEIKRLYQKGLYQKVIARRFGLHQGQVSRIVNGRSNNPDPFMEEVFQRILGD